MLPRSVREVSLNPMTDLNQATVLVTGATGGFGRHMARQFREAGSRLVLTDLDGRGLDLLKSELDADGGESVRVFAADLSDVAGCRSLYNSVSGAGIVPDVLVNNAGLGVAGRLDHVPEDRWERLMQVNLLAPIRLCYLFLPAMIERGSGHVVNISSLAGWVGSPGLSTYCASKFGLRGLSECLALELAEHGLRLSTVYPSFSRTPIIDSDRFGYDEPRRVPDDMLSDPADVVAAVVKGVQKNQQHIFPDLTSRTVHYLHRYLPAVMPLLQRRLERRTREAGTASGKV